MADVIEKYMNKLRRRRRTMDGAVAENEQLLLKDKLSDVENTELMASKEIINRKLKEIVNLFEELLDLVEDEGQNDNIGKDAYDYELKVQKTFEINRK